jgi:hypothetical protein
MNTMHEFRQLPRVAGAAEYFRSPAYLSTLDAIGSDPRAQAQLAIALLGHMALDPTFGTKASDFCVVSGKGAESRITFNLQFDRIVNMLGIIELPASAIEAGKVIVAIHENLSSPRYKAAAMLRRLKERRTSVLRPVEKRASAEYCRVYNEVYQQVTASAKQTARGYCSDEDHARARAEAYTAACSAKEVILKPVRDRVDRRIQAVADVAAPEAPFSGGYYAVLEAFATRYIAPALTH